VLVLVLVVLVASSRGRLVLVASSSRGRLVLVAVFGKVLVLF
jgi:hypothetical protein